MSMSRKKCCVPGCLDSGSSHPTLHSFPSPQNDRDRFNDWVLSIGGNIIGLDNEDIYKHRSVCRAHFEERYLCRNNRLSANAVPTLNLPGPLALPKFTYEERRPLREIQDPKPSTSSEGSPKELLTVGMDKENKGLPKYAYIKKRSLKQTEESPTTSSDVPLLEQKIEDSMPTISTLVPLLEQKIEDSIPKISTLVPLLEQKIEDSIPKISTLDGQNNRPGIGKTVKKKTKYIKVSREENHLYEKLIQARIRLSKCRNKIKKQTASLKAAKNIASNPAFLSTMENLSTAAKTLFMMQFREKKKKNKGRRFTVNEKILALSIFKQAPKSYRFLRRLFILPAPQTLAKLINKANINAGINKNIFDQIKKMTKKMKTEHKLCIVLFDEMHLKAGVSYNERKDKIIGLATNGEETKQDFADHAQVFVIRGLIKNYKQSVSYTFSAAPTSGQEICKQLKSVITELQNAGLIVAGTVCDQGTNNRNAIKLLLQETRGIYLRNGTEPKENVILINNQEIVPLYDPPHLLKCIRNNLLTKNLEYSVNGVKKIAKWDHIKLLHSKNPGYRGIRLIPKLTDSHVMPEKSKMKVKYATQIFSRTVASNMGYLAEVHVLPEECKETADALLFFDNLFDSQNGSYVKKDKQFAKPLLGPVTPTSVHHEEWTRAKHILQSMKFISKSGNPENVPTLKNWAWTLESLEVLLKNLENHFNITSVWMRHLNQDPIENFFGAVRSHGCRNTNPTPEKFEGSFATLLINNMSSVHALPGANCEADNCTNLYALIVPECEAATASSGIDFYLPNIEADSKEAEANNPCVIGMLNYMTGYFVKKTQSKVFKNCQTCKNDFISIDQHEYIKYREYAGRRWLCSPTPAAVTASSDIQKITNAILKENIHKKNIGDIIKTNALMFAEFDFMQCQEHRADNINFMLKLTSRFYIYNYCKEINKILSGKIDCIDNEDMLQVKAKKHYKKCFKRPFK